MKKRLLTLALPLALIGAKSAHTEDESVAIIGAVLHDLPAYHDDVKYEDDEGRYWRMKQFAKAQWDVSHLLTCSGKYASVECARKFEGTSQQLRRLLLTAGWWETRYSWRMHHGKCKKNECDSGKAVSVYQVHDQLFFPEGLWASSKGASDESTYNSTLAAGLAFSQAWKSCYAKHGILGVWDAYGRGDCTTRFPTDGSRVRWYYDSAALP